MTGAVRGAVERSNAVSGDARSWMMGRYTGGTPVASVDRGPNPDGKGASMARGAVSTDEGNALRSGSIGRYGGGTGAGAGGSGREIGGGTGMARSLACIIIPCAAAGGPSSVRDGDRGAVRLAIPGWGAGAFGLSGGSPGAIVPAGRAESTVSNAGLGVSV